MLTWIWIYIQQLLQNRRGNYPKVQSHHRRIQYQNVLVVLKFWIQITYIQNYVQHQSQILLYRRRLPHLKISKITSKVSKIWLKKPLISNQRPRHLLSWRKKYVLIDHQAEVLHGQYWFDRPPPHRQRRLLRHSNPLTGEQLPRRHLIHLHLQHSRHGPTEEKLQLHRPPGRAGLQLLHLHPTRPLLKPYNHIGPNQNRILIIAHRFFQLKIQK